MGVVLHGGAGKREEHLVQGRPADAQVVEGDPGVLETTADIEQQPVPSPAGMLNSLDSGSDHGRVRSASASSATARSTSPALATRASRVAPPACDFSSSVVPSAITLPLSMTTIRFARYSASSMYWVGEEHRSAAADELPDEVPEIVAGARVQSGSGLVQKEDRGTPEQAGPDVKAAPHAAGVRFHLAVSGVRE